MEHLPTPRPSLTDSLRGLIARTPARILQGRAGTAYRTCTQLTLRSDHAAARDAVHADLTLNQIASPEMVQELGLFEVQTQAADKSEYLMRPDLGRCFSSFSRELILKNCTQSMEMQVVIGDGLSAMAVVRQVPLLLTKLREYAENRGWSFGRPFLIRYCRVGILNEIGDLIHPKVVVLLIGERPGLASAESLSAYMAYSPRSGHTDAQRNLISNIHNQGVSPTEAVVRIFSLAEQMRAKSFSGVDVKEEIPELGMNVFPQIGS